MSRNVSKNSSKQVVQKYCKVCHDSGKTEAEYRSHCTRESRDPNSKVICPTLLALECQYCFKKGHTVKYCKVLKDKERTNKYVSSAPKDIKNAPVSNKPAANVFSCLDSDSEDEAVPVPKQQVKEEFPVLAAPAVNRTQNIAFNYASALAKPAAPKPIEKPVEKPVEKPIEKREYKISGIKAAPWASTAPKNTKSWAESDSEDDDEQYDAYEEEAYAHQSEEYDSDW